MTWNFSVENLNLYALVFCRIGGMILFNPLIQRKNIPSQFKLALILLITILISPTISAQNTEPIVSGFGLLIMMIKELTVGVAFGFVFQIFYYLLFTAGDIIDMGFGLSMAKAFDPGTNMQMSISGNLFQLLFGLYFFATDSHLIMIKIMTQSYKVVNVGAVVIGKELAQFVMSLFVTAFSLVLHLALPFIAASLVLELSMGVLMKLIPQINVFSIHFQFKILIGFLLLYLFAGPVSTFLTRYIDTMLVQMQNLLTAV